ncbi:COG3178: Predicted phosphotransferase related toSer/Thr protein kinases [Bathymodiolus heckerae thiotrophic gill symbiont]|uniref:aminoglycoside phosphotransferase family protein n=1 Tax=Bathymodiolus heckerae thiotrophic gill symbiont TaxID=1052212 RepID=UPI0010B8B761|nr:phosphotransferase [Bathymodiolus heckerae thiotrophic gill symbiont]CAC9956786.1 Phosphotransferase involved in threonylcarbamoyladenosine t(6)A37 formation in tRNA [uncultured Gammaproteobacteria bacterium]SHN90062.1 COG3178: Predicted phosphotransferase related toSer/Thr protein kinases [Bathymodiolus heckerae thiotrophic gill symbiont]
MHDERLDQLEDWLEIFFNDANFILSKASDDASFRRYFRIERSNLSFIAMDAPPEKENSKRFVEIAELLRNNNIHAPKIIDKDLSQGFLLIEDLGSATFLQALNNKNKLALYKRAIDELIKIQAINTQNISFDLYDETLLKTELNLLIDWYLPKDINQDSLDKLFDQLIKNSLNSEQVFVHRDYHCRNLMITNNDISVIDFQDAVIGSNSYDLVSLLKDAYVELESSELQALLVYFHKQSELTISFDKFEKQFDLMGLQRHLKILGIFKRLSLRDDKHQYLDDIPLIEKYVLQMADKYPEFNFLKGILNLAKDYQ